MGYISSAFQFSYAHKCDTYMQFDVYKSNCTPFHFLLQKVIKPRRRLSTINRHEFRHLPSLGGAVLVGVSSENAIKAEIKLSTTFNNQNKKRKQRKSTALKLFEDSTLGIVSYFYLCLYCSFQKRYRSLFFAKSRAFMNPSHGGQKKQTQETSCALTWSRKILGNPDNCQARKSDSSESGKAAVLQRGKFSMFFTLDDGALCHISYPRKKRL